MHCSKATQKDDFENIDETSVEQLYVFMSILEVGIVIKSN